MWLLMQVMVCMRSGLSPRKDGVQGLPVGSAHGMVVLSEAVLLEIRAFSQQKKSVGVETASFGGSRVDEERFQRAHSGEPAAPY